MRTADVTVSAGGWDFTSFLCFFSSLVTEGGKNALAPGVTQAILRNTGDGPAWKYTGRTINPPLALFYDSAVISLHVVKNCKWPREVRRVFC